LLYALRSKSTCQKRFLKIDCRFKMFTFVWSLRKVIDGEILECKPSGLPLIKLKLYTPESIETHGYASLQNYQENLCSQWS